MRTWLAGPGALRSACRAGLFDIALLATFTLAVAPPLSLALLFKHDIENGMDTGAKAVAMAVWLAGIAGLFHIASRLWELSKATDPYRDDDPAA